MILNICQESRRTRNPDTKISISRHNIGIEFDDGKCALLIMKKGRKGTLKRTEQSNESMRIFRQKENYKYFKILEMDTIKQLEIKVKVKVNKRGYLRRKRKLFETNHCRRKLIRGMNNRAVLLIFIKTDEWRTLLSISLSKFLRLCLLKVKWLAERIQEICSPYDIGTVFTSGSTLRRYLLMWSH